MVIVKEVIIVKDALSCGVSPVAMFGYVKMVIFSSSWFDFGYGTLKSVCDLFIPIHTCG